MYTECTIQFVDDGEIWENQIIKAYDSDDDADELIFFYGLSRLDLEAACESGEAICGEWKVLSVGATYDKIY